MTGRRIVGLSVVGVLIALAALLPHLSPAPSTTRVTPPQAPVSAQRSNLQVPHPPSIDRSSIPLESSAPAVREENTISVRRVGIAHLLGMRYGELVTAAENSNAAAAYVLWKRLERCERIPLEDSFEKWIARFPNDSAPDKAGVESLKQARAFCLQAPVEERGAASEWLELAAQSGNLDAQLRVLSEIRATLKVDGSPPDDWTSELLDSVETKALNGDAKALGALSTIYRNGSLTGPNRVKAYAYFAAARRIAELAGGPALSSVTSNAGATRADMLARLQSGLTQLELSEAEVMIEQILRSPGCCTLHERQSPL